MIMLNEYKKLKMQIEYLDEQEQKNLENWMAYSRQKRLDYVNQLAYIKREIEQKILDEYKKLENANKLIGVF